MDDGFLLQSVEGLGDSPFVATGGEIWELLQGEKEEVCRDLNAEGPLFRSEAGGLRDTNLRKRTDARSNGGIEDCWKPVCATSTTPRTV